MKGENNLCFERIDKNTNAADLEKYITLRKEQLLKSLCKAYATDDLIRKETETYGDLNNLKIVLVKDKGNEPIGIYNTGTLQEGNKLTLLSTFVTSNHRKNINIKKAMLEHVKELAKELNRNGVVVAQRKYSKELEKLLQSAGYQKREVKVEAEPNQKFHMREYNV